MSRSQVGFELFKNSIFWKDMPDSFWEYCQRHGRVRRYAAKQFLFFSGEEGNSVFFLLKGRVQLLLMSEFTEKIYRILQGPAYFPESVLDGKSYPYGALTAEESDVFIMDRNALVKYLQDNPELLWPFYQSMSLDLRRAYRQIKNIALGDARSRLGAKLFALAHVHGKKVDEGILISIPLTATELAAMCSLARESVSRILGELKDLNLIQIEKKKILITDTEELREWIAERQNSG